MYFYEVFGKCDLEVVVDEFLKLAVDSPDINVTEAEPTWAFIPGLNQRTVDKSTEKWLQEIYDNLDFSEWYAGHYHVESEENGIRIMFEDYDEICEKLN